MDWLLHSQTPIIDPLIPPAPLSLEGRDVELRHLKERLRSEAVISLNGLPGVGKTTLAVVVAHDPEIRTHFPDGVLWAPLGTTPDIFGQLRRWGALFGLHESQMGSGNIETLAQAARSAIEQRRMLLILDDAWTVEDVLAFEVGGPHCAYLVTTRFSNVATQLARCELRTLHELSTEQSLDLLHLLAPQVVEGEASRARALAEAVGGLPLALMLMGNYLRWRVSSGQSRRIQEALERLNHAEMRLHLSEPRSPLQRHPSFEAGQLLSLHAIIALTDQYLSEQARAALYALCVLPHKPGIFCKAVALAVGTCSTERVCDLLQVLGAVAASRGDYLQSEMYLQEGVNLARQTDDRKRLCALLMSLGVTVSERGDVSQGEMYLQEGLALARTIGHKEWICALLCNLGAAATVQERYAQAEMYQREGLSIARQIGHREWMSMLLLNLGETAAAQEKYIQATLYFQETVKLVQHLGRPQLTARAFYELGNLYLKQQEIEEAEATFQEMLSIIPQGDVELHALSRYGLARLSAAQGNFQKARQLGEDSATAFESMKHPEAKQVRGWLASIASA